MKALMAPSLHDVDELLLHYAWWPRLAVALLAGAGVALALWALLQIDLDSVGGSLLFSQWARHVEGCAGRDCPRKKRTSPSCWNSGHLLVSATTPPGVAWP
ncbi:MAG: hypothetical protein JJU25_09980 [Halomonas sp.]|nr:hypothetical protein [Halomonas sp.]